MLNWILFALIALFWGSSFFWIKIALREIGPYALVAWRLVFASGGLLLLLRVSHKEIPRAPVTLRRLVLMACLAPTIPFILISWGETRVDSTVASVLNGTIPLLTMLFGHLFLHDEKITRWRALGLATGFAGVLVLFSRGLQAGAFTGSVWGLAACMGAELLYAFSGVFSRWKLRNMSPVVQTSVVMLVGNLIAWPAVLLLEERGRIFPRELTTWVSLAWMGLFGSCAAFIGFFHLLNKWGMTRAAVVNYVVPVVGLLLGIVFLGEPADWRLIGGSALIVGALVLINVFAPRRSGARSGEAQSARRAGAPTALPREVPGA